MCTIKQISLTRTLRLVKFIKHAETRSIHWTLDRSWLVEPYGFGQCGGNRRDLFEVVSSWCWWRVWGEGVRKCMAHSCQHLHHLEPMTVHFELRAQSLYEPRPIVGVLEWHVSCNSKIPTYTVTHSVFFNDPFSQTYLRSGYYPNADFCGSTFYRPDSPTNSINQSINNIPINMM